MTFENDQEAINLIKAHQQVPTWVNKAREQRKELFALIDGDNFAEELITKIEHIESVERAESRKKYSRSVQDFYERLFQPITNVFNSTGGSKAYDIESDKTKDEFLKKIGNVRDDKSIQSYVETDWMPLYHKDPNGVIFMEYKSGEDAECWPTYKSIDNIRSYWAKGQKVEWILFEPREVKLGKSDSTIKIWRLVDDKEDRYVVQEGATFTVLRGDNLEVFGQIEIRTYEHPFGTTPAIVNSNIIKTGERLRLSPIYNIVPASREYARDQSIKSIYKFLHGFPIFWRYVTQCRTCTGTGKNGTGNCGTCNGVGFAMKKDVTDAVTLPVPKGDQAKIAPDIAGYIQPDLDTWTKYSEELKENEDIIHKSHWGSFIQHTGNETATARFIDVQPVINRLNKYADVAEYVEAKITEWIANFVDPNKDKELSIAQVHYGRRYIIEPLDVILENYQQAKEKGDNSVILDRLLAEYLTAKYNNDPEGLFANLQKAKVEPYVHNTLEEVLNVFGQEEAQRKVMFNKWWQSLAVADMKKDTETLITQYATWFKPIKIKVDEDSSSKPT